MRSGLLLALLAGWGTFSAAAPPTSYKVVSQLPAGDGGWDLLSVSPDDQRLYIAHGDGVTAIDLRTGIATDKIVAGQRVHAALAIPGTHDVLSTNGETNNALLFDGRNGKNSSDNSDRYEARRRRMGPGNSYRLDHGSRERRGDHSRPSKCQSRCDGYRRRLTRTWRRRWARQNVRKCRGQERGRCSQHPLTHARTSLPTRRVRWADRDRL